MKIDVKIDGMRELQQDLQRLSDRGMRNALAAGMTRTAVHVREVAQNLAASVFDRPTPYTLKQLRYTGASGDRLVAEVGFNIAAVTDVHGKVQAYRALGAGGTPASKYLQFQADGGRRRAKRFEVALQRVGVLPAGWVTVPGERAKLDAYGNQSPGELRQILSWFDAAELVAGSRQNMRDAGRDKRRKGTRKTAGWEYVLVSVGGRRSFARSGGGGGWHGMQPGVYRRTHTAMGTRVEPVLIFVRQASYRARFDFDEVTHRAAQARLPQEINRAVSEAIARRSGRG